MDVLKNHMVLILSILLGVSELLALMIPSAGGILAAVVALLKMLGAKDVEEQPKV